MKKPKENKKSTHRYVRYRQVINYFEENNYGLMDTLDLSYARMKVNECFIHSDMDKIISELSINIKYLKMLNRYFSNREHDYRPGIETYGYENQESIKETLMYIADRWNSAFRTKWLIDLIE